MSRNDLMVTVVGWAATKPKEVIGGVPFTSFRLATTPRYFDNRQGGWADGRTEWLTVKVFRDVALNVASSINKGDPVLVHGRLCTQEWQGDAGPRTSLVVEAAALGHDLTRGRSVFARTIRVPRPEDSEATAEPDDVCAPATGEGEVDPWARDAAAASVDEPAEEDEMAPEVVGVLTP